MASVPSCEPAVQRSSPDSDVSAVQELLRFGGIALTGVPQIAWLLYPIPLSLKALHVAVLAVAIARPSHGLLLLAGLGPLATWMAGIAGASPGGGRVLEMMLLACLSGFLLRMRPGVSPTRLGAPAALVAAAALASMAAELPSRLLFHHPGAGWWDTAALLFRGEYFGRSPAFEPMFFASLAVGGAALAWMTERLSLQDKALAGRILWLILIAHAVAGLFAVHRFTAAALGPAGDAAGLIQYLAAVQVSPFYDKNAAGSVLAMVLLAGVGLRSGSPRWRILASGMLTVIGAALILSGARLALAAAVACLFGGLFLFAVRQRRALLVPSAIALVVVLLGISALWSRYPEGRNLDGMFAGRLAMARAAARMTQEAPWFGIGIGTFYERSFEFGGQSLLWHVSPENPRENAHNNFLQVLAEQGVTGLAAFLILLGAGFWPAWTILRQGTSEQRWLLMGLSAFVITWLGSHPLLVREAVVMFWLLFGVLAAQVPTHARRKRAARLLWASAAIVLLSAVPRAALERRAALLEHIGIGVSLWQQGEDGMRYREAGETFSLYLPTDTLVRLPVRRAPDTPDPLLLEIRTGGRLGDTVLLGGEAWSVLRLQVPAAREEFARFDFTVTATEAPPDLSSPAVHVGKTIVP